MITNHGTQFESELFSEIASIVDFYMNSYHTQTNGMTKYVHITIKTALIARKESWLDAIQIILMGICVVSNSSNTSPFFTVIGTRIMIPQLLVDDTNDNRDNQKFAKELQCTLHSLHSTNKSH